MPDIEAKQAVSSPSHAAPWCQVQQVQIDHESQSSTQGPFNPLAEIVPNASVGDEAYQDDCYHGPRRDWLSRQLLPPPQNFVDIGIKALNVMAIVGSLAINRGKPPPRIIKKPANVDMLGQAFTNLKGMRADGATFDELGNAFAIMARDIMRLTQERWAATRTRSSDGAHIFYGPNGRAFVINPERQFFLGFMYHGGVREVGGGRLELDYSLLRQLH